MTATKTPAGLAGSQTPAPPATHAGTPTPCVRAPHLFVVEARSRLVQVEAAVWLCRRRCRRFTWCQRQPKASMTVMAGSVIDRHGRSYTPQGYFGGKTRKRVKSTASRLCRGCGKSFTGQDKRAWYCGDACRLIAKRRSSSEYEQRQVNRHGPTTRRPTHCKHNHEFTPENTDYTKRGDRRCLTCRNGRARTQLEVAA